MALKALLLKKKINDKKQMLEDLRAKDAEFTKREEELTQAIDEAETEEDKAAVEEEANKFDAEKQEHEDAKSNLESEVEGLETELKETEAADEAAQAAAEEARAAANKIQTREEKISMNARARRFFGKMSASERAAMFEREDIKTYLAGVRETIKNKRAVTNIGLTIPEVLLGLLRENIENYSKLYKHVNAQPVSGEARQPIMGTIPEAIWTECCANLNELTIGFNDVEVDCYKVGGFFKLCNAVIEDSDIDLAATLIDVIGQSIGLALDKAILYGGNTAQTLKMPYGIMSRLVQTSKPAGYPPTARDWADLHTSNIVTIPSTATGVALFQGIILAAGHAKGKYSRGEKVWVMNETTYTKLKAEALSINAAGAIVSGMEGSMPVVGGIVEVLDFIPDDVIIGGYFDLYTLAERAGQKFAESEHVAFIQDQTVFKGTARYDGKPAIAEAFVAIGINSVTPDATMTFALDAANTVEMVALNIGAANLVIADTLQLEARTAPVDGAITWASSDTSVATVDTNGLVTAAGAGSCIITATSNGHSAACALTVASA